MAARADGVLVIKSAFDLSFRARPQRETINQERQEGTMNPEVARSYTFCEALARRTAGNFYPAFRVLPPRQRQAMCALYAFMRIADDLSDEPAPLADKQQQLRRWRADFDRAWYGDFCHPIHAALHDTLHTHHIPRTYLDAALDGVEMDLLPVAYRTFADLQLYCYRVASVVGLACIHIWGFRGDQAKGYAEQAGIAFQMTNILRDLGEDAARGRVYLPAEDLKRFGYDAAGLRRVVGTRASGR